MGKITLDYIRPKTAALLLAFLLAIGGAAQAQDSGTVAASSEPYVYQVEQLQNGGGGEIPLELDTPMGMIETFTTAGAKKDWQAASAAMDFAHVDADAARQQELAAQLYDLVHRSMSIDWADLPDRPDAVDILASDKNPMAGVARRSLRLATLDIDGRTVPIRLARLQQPGGQPLWVFSRQTVANVPELYAIYGPTKFEQSLPPMLRKQAFWTLAWWEVIALPLILLLGAFAAALTYRAIGRWSDRMDEDDKIHGVLQAVHLPMTLLAFAGTFALVRSTFFRLSGPVSDILNPLQLLLIIAAVIGILLSALDFLFDFATTRRTRKLEAPENNEDRDFYTKMSAIRRILTAVLLLAGVGVLLVASNMSNTLGFSIIASAGVLGLVLVFAARKVLGDIMASVQIAFARSARIGDAVYYENQWCYVEKIGFTHLRLRSWDERRGIVPGSDFTSESFENWTKQDPSLMTHVELELDHRCDVDALRGPFRDFLANDEDVIDPEDAACEVVGHSARAMVVRFKARSPDPKSGWKMHCRLREHMLAAAARLDAGEGNEPAPAFIPREREVRMDTSATEKAG